MSITILSIVESIGETQSSTIDVCDDNTPLRDKQLVYRDLLGIDSTNLPNIYFVKYNKGEFHNIHPCNPGIVKIINNYNPDIYISHISDQKIKFIRPKLAILYDMVNKQIMCNGTINVTFDDVDEEYKNKLLDPEFVENRRNGQFRYTTQNINDEFNIKTEREYRYLRNGYLEENVLLKRAFMNVTKRLIIEFIKNPTITATKKDDKVELLEIVNLQKSLIAEMSNKLDELENRIRNM